MLQHGLSSDKEEPAPSDAPIPPIPSDPPIKMEQPNYWRKVQRFVVICGVVFGCCGVAFQYSEYGRNNFRLAIDQTMKCIL